MTQTPPQVPYIPPASALPGGTPPQVDGDLASLGTTCLVLATLEILYALYKVAMSALSLFLMQSALSGSPPSASGLDPMLELTQRYMLTASLTEMGRMVPYLVASGVLIAIAFRLRQGQAAALRATRLWAWCALAVVVLSVLVTAAITLPLSFELQEAVARQVPTGSAPPPGGTWELFGMLSGIISMVVGAVVMSIWPVVLLFWTDKLERQLAVK